MSVTQRPAPIAWERQKASYLELIDDLTGRTGDVAAQKSAAAPAVSSARWNPA